MRPVTSPVKRLPLVRLPKEAPVMADTMMQEVGESSAPVLPEVKQVRKVLFTQDDVPRSDFDDVLVNSPIPVGSESVAETSAILGTTNSPAPLNGVLNSVNVMEDNPQVTENQLVHNGSHQPSNSLLATSEEDFASFSPSALLFGDSDPNLFDDFGVLDPAASLITGGSEEDVSEETGIDSIQVTSPTKPCVRVGDHKAKKKTSKAAKAILGVNSKKRHVNGLTPRKKHSSKQETNVSKPKADGDAGSKNGPAIPKPNYSL